MKSVPGGISGCSFDSETYLIRRHNSAGHHSSAFQVDSYRRSSRSAAAVVPPRQSPARGNASIPMRRADLQRGF